MVELRRAQGPQPGLGLHASPPVGELVSPLDEGSRFRSERGTRGTCLPNVPERMEGRGEEGACLTASRTRG